MSNLNMFRILIVDDNPAIHQDFRKILSRTNDCEALDQLEHEFFESLSTPHPGLPVYEVDSAFQGAEGVDKVASALLENRPYAVAFVELRIPSGISGVETIGRMWALAPDLHVVASTAFSDVSWDEMLASLGWSDRLFILKKPSDQIEICQMALALSMKHRLEEMARDTTDNLRAKVTKRTIELEQEIQRRKKVEAMLLEKPIQFYDDSEVDPTTGLLNRNSIMERIKCIANDTNLHGGVYSILFVDVDRMQDVNNVHGQLAGDLVLKNVAQRLKETLRPNDVIGRYGGEEFILGLRNCSREHALLVAERLRQRVAESTIDVDGASVKITVSVGVATQDTTFHAVAEKVLECADQALGKAKINGRNRVVAGDLASSIVQ